MDQVRTAAERETRHRHRAVLLIGSVDRRIVPALRFAARLADADVRAMHVSVDAEETRRLARDWMALDLTWLPLHVRDGSPETFLRSVCRAVEEVLEEPGDVTVILPEAEHRGLWCLLHRRSALRIARALRAHRRVATVIVPYFVPGSDPG